MLNGQRTKNENCDNLLILILFQTCMNSSFSAEQNNEILQIPENDSLFTLSDLAVAVHTNSLMQSSDSLQVAQLIYKLLLKRLFRRAYSPGADCKYPAIAALFRWKRVSQATQCARAPVLWRRPLGSLPFGVLHMHQTSSITKLREKEIFLFISHQLPQIIKEQLLCRFN